MRRLKIIPAVISAAVIFFMAGAAYSSVEEYKKAVELDSDSVIKRFNLGYAYYQGGNYDRAAETLKKTLEMERDKKEDHARVDTDAAQILGIIFFNNKKDYDKAIKYFKKVAEMNPADGDNYYYMGLAYLAKNDNKKALGAFLTALEKGTKEKTEANFRAGEIYYRNRIYGNAIEYLNKVVKVNPKHMQAREFLGLIYHKRKKHDKAIDNFTYVVKYNPENFNAHYLLGLNFFAEKKYDKMISAYKKAITINPDFADAHYNLGMAYYYRGLYGEAIKELEKAKKLNPSDAATFSLLAQAKEAAYDSRLSKGTTFFTEDELLNARKEFRLALDVRPGDSEAKKYLNKVKEEIEKKIPVKLEKAGGYFNSGKLSEAWREWNWVAQADPGNSKAGEGLKKIEKNSGILIAAKEKLAKKYVSEGKYEEALGEYRAVKRMPGVSRNAVNKKIFAIKKKQREKVSDILGSAAYYYRKKSYKKAINKYNSALKYDADNEKALNGITKVNQAIEADKEKYLAIGKQNVSSNPGKARNYFKKVLALDPHNSLANRYIEKLTGKKSQVMLDAKQIKTLYYRGVDKYVNGEIESAIKIWQKVLSLDKNHVEARKNINRAREKLKAIKSLGR